MQPILAEAQPPSLPGLKAALASIVSRDATGVADKNFTLTFFLNPARPPTSSSGAIVPANGLEREFRCGLFTTEWLGSRESGGQFQSSEGEMEFLPDFRKMLPWGEAPASCGALLGVER